MIATPLARYSAWQRRGDFIFLSGVIDKAVTVKGISVTKGAKAAIEAAGGSIEE